MSHPTELTFKTLQFYSTAVYPCSYLPGLDARSQVAAPTHLIDAATYSSLVEQGFRRSGLFTYRPHCDSCQACLPIRVDTERHTPNRSQRKAWKRHANLSARTMPLLWDPEHFQLYDRYQQGRHPGAGMDEDSQTQYRQFLLTSRVDSRLVEFRLPSGQLQMVSVIDVLETGLSSVYTFYDPDAAGSLGTYGILWQLEQCRSLGLPWLYLGYWIRESRKMAYKSQYTPYQILQHGVWTEPAAT
ncbi:arginyltransferase [Pollutimonas bauzanensis]|uniref:Aspartate/glutamate leucyltransferase n=1 Tax=Pollutimonas bauzanensis TaxID=658167 RepID=A0A1M5X302_9BURK|nr:arginyltransferase [Pollutimonas bauzanensis]SHH94215.1 arginine-tRNA-protein transferase [Pollutimonas bauzanensis]